MLCFFKRNKKTLFVVLILVIVLFFASRGISSRFAKVKDFSLTTQGESTNVKGGSGVVKSDDKSAISKSDTFYDSSIDKYDFQIEDLGPFHKYALDEHGFIFQDRQVENFVRDIEFDVIPVLKKHLAVRLDVKNIQDSEDLKYIVLPFLDNKTNEYLFTAYFPLENEVRECTFK